MIQSHVSFSERKVRSVRKKFVNDSEADISKTSVNTTTRSTRQSLRKSVPPDAHSAPCESVRSQNENERSSSQTKPGRSTKSISCGLQKRSNNEIEDVPLSSDNGISPCSKKARTPTTTHRKSNVENDSPSTLISQRYINRPHASNTGSEKKLIPLQLFKADATPYAATRKALYTSVPKRVLCRDRQLDDINDFLSRHTDCSGSLYISGAPGTGKTASLTHLLDDRQFAGVFKKVVVNCMSVKTAGEIYGKIAKELNTKYNDSNTESEALKCINRFIVKSSTMILLILDEIDQLDSRNHEVLYTLFEWAASKVVLIGIANALDLTDRILPRLHSRPNIRPELLHFQPYTKKQIIAVITSRLEEAAITNSDILKPTTITFVAGKIASVSGDMRKALDICRRAIEMVETDDRRQLVLKKTCDDGNNPGSPRKDGTHEVHAVTLPHIMKLLNGVYGTQATEPDAGNSHTLPLHEKFVVCCLLLLIKKTNSKEITLGKLTGVYKKVCQKRHVSPVDQSEFLSICQMIESKGIIVLKLHKEARMTKITLRLDENEVKLAIKDTSFLFSILQDTDCVTTF